MTDHNASIQHAKRLILFFGLTLSISSATAGVILNPYNFGASQIQYYEPIGQSFTAEDAFVKASLWYVRMNPSYPVDSITLSLYSGFGSTGTLLASDTFTLSAGYEGFYDSDFSSIALTVGNIYSLAASIPGTSPYWGVGSGDSYAGGEAFTNVGAGGDRAFRVTPVSATVPEPASLALLGLGLAGLSFSRCKKT